MSELKEQVVLRCPLGQAEMRLRNFFAEHGTPNGDAARIVLKSQINIGGVVPSHLERPVIVTMQLHPKYGDMTPRFRIQWAPEIPGPFPIFTGELFVESWDDYDSFIMKLEGSYSPPFGLIGKGFDVILGRHIADATAEDLLERIRCSIERAYQKDEEQKAIRRLAVGLH